MNAAWEKDVASIEAILVALYECISGPAGAPRNWARFHYLHRPESLSLRTVVREDGGYESQVFTNDEYIANVEPLFAQMAFYEIETAHRVERFGQVAHVWSKYEARSSPDSPDVIKRGANSIQLFNDGRRWWIVSTIWDNEREGLAFDLF